MHLGVHKIENIDLGVVAKKGNHANVLSDARAAFRTATVRKLSYAAIQN
jgi:hypothetical protein